MVHILNQPMVAVAGRRSESRSAIILMHAGYDRGGESLVDHAWKLPPGRYLVAGALDNPNFSWPVYADVREEA